LDIWHNGWFILPKVQKVGKEMGKEYGKKGAKMIKIKRKI